MDSDELTCPNCGSTEGPRGTKQDRDVIELVCDDCSHLWTRVPRQPCPRCGSGDIEIGGYEGWAFEDVEQARDDTMAEWHYVDQATSGVESAATNGRPVAASSATRGDGRPHTRRDALAWLTRTD